MRGHHAAPGHQTNNSRVLGAPKSEKSIHVLVQSITLYIQKVFFGLQIIVATDSAKYRMNNQGTKQMKAMCLRYD